MLENLPARLASRIAVSPSGCWLWTGPAARTGYAYVHVAGADRLVHRVTYEMLVGPIPERYQIDHLCRVRACVNPEHLEAVTQRENIARSSSKSARAVRSDICFNGHPLRGENLFLDADGYRGCKTCAREKYRRYDAKRRGAGRQPKVVTA